MRCTCCGWVCYVVQHLHLLVMKILAQKHGFHRRTLPQIVPSGVVMIWLFSLMFLWSFTGSRSTTFDLSPVDAGSGFGLGFIYSSWPGYYMFHWCNVPHNCHMWCQTPNLPFVLPLPAKMWAYGVVRGQLLVTKKLVPSAQQQMKGPLVVPADLAALENLLNRSEDWNNLPC